MARIASSAIPRRSSARLRNQNAPNTPTSTSALSGMVERVETPDRGVPLNLNSVIASAPAKTTIVPLNDTIATTPSARIKPASEEMHPSHHQSAVKKRASALRNGTADSSGRFVTTDRDIQSKAEPGAPMPQLSPAANPFSSPTFDFKFHRPSTDLSTEAQRMMGEVREQAAKIKSQLFTQRDQSSANTARESATGRKLANPKGNIGRFSNVHMEEFKRMASIANHPSSFRADPSKQYVPNKSLKRSKSNVDLDEPAKDTCHPIATKPEHCDTSERSSSPAKRTKLTGATSTVTTPTKATLARSSSVKSSRAEDSKLPLLVLSPSTKSLLTPTATKVVRPNTDVKPRSAFASKLTGGVRSILRRPQLKFSDDPQKIAAGTHFSTPQKAASVSKAGNQDVLEKTPASPSHRKEKHVNFSSSPDQTIPSLSAAPPSPSKQPIEYPSLPEVEPDPFTPTRHSLFPNEATRASIVGPVDFTFRAENTISFSPPKPANPSMTTNTTPTIRPVRPSNAVTACDGIASGLEFPTVAHGLSNKKRKRESPSLEQPQENKENDLPEEQTEMVAASPTKKAKLTPKPTLNAVKTPVKKLKSPIKDKGRSILSLSRLNALSKPKNRG